MAFLLDALLNNYQIFLLVLVRVTGLFIATPIFSRNNVPNTLKVCFAVLLSFVLFNTIELNYISNNILDFTTIVIKELAIGLIIGFISYLFFTSLYFAGQVVDMQIGFGMVNVLDPQSNIQVPIMGTFYHLIAILVFLTIDGHHFLIDALVSSYKYIPIGHFAFTENIIKQLAVILGQTLIIGFKISSPVLATIFLADVLLGILARTMPQMNVFIVGMPLKISVGIVTIVVSLPLFFIALQHIFNNMYEEIFNFLKVIQRG
ncbi:flagellar biosynthetic protein FliR [Brassicibacter mesophilus]|uniref:flagellar biosynthetic protein FliR n=1 Tax=Brassicibacter mesophilus TaxID=745119 RepID=UPI003D1C5411